MPTRAKIGLLLCMLWAWLAGCGEHAADAQPGLRLLSVLYGQYRAAHRGQLPANEADFKRFIVSERAEALKQGGVSSVDELFVSDRDHKPLVIRYRNDRQWPLEGVVAYEQEGADGVRHIATDLGGAAELTDEQFNSRTASGSNASKG